MHAGYDTVGMFLNDMIYGNRVENFMIGVSANTFLIKTQ